MLKLAYGPPSKPRQLLIAWPHEYGRAGDRSDRRRRRAERGHRIVDLHACEWGQLAALGHSADLMYSNSVARADEYVTLTIVE